MSTEIPKEYLDLHEKRLHEMLEVIEKAQWKLSKEEPTIKFYTSSYPGSSFSMVKSVVYVNGKADEAIKILDQVPTIDANTPKELADGAKERYLFGGVEGGARYLYMSLDSGSRFVSDREFLLLRKRYDLEDKKVWLCVSIDNTELKPVAKGNVRGNMTFQAYILDKDPANGEDRLTFVVHADPCGSIPAVLYNSVAVNQGNGAKRIRDDIFKQ
ncbi:hypothetical protein TVAG_041150 [Trichomonas vaginalis G3]|uniref:START domain-containing protein n=1 Tax=Trichomonas vaginalis (strain ATCC PRA-98 / G3) TaxID=412133 RepID=A2FWS7_TRIV3|nr:lipid-binding START domain-containing protein [Trichomonas vaginalis G3]EAX90640.1 hypothetical protein TVAG_041150 [Trichomonas vaginalis G3]KAI5502848.1 lipid-binding START domain-containing protein [Trichomonas vaginalis G3]|eukprot:XP_001303570.1 hypothetical protein [Trichomonas vaginalis G3]